MKDKKSRIVVIRITTIIKVLLVIVFTMTILYLLFYFYNSYKNKILYDHLFEEIKIEQYIVKEEIIENITKEEIPKVISECVEKVKRLQQENEDVKGWISIEGTVINYPLLQTADNDYYLTRNYKKEKSKYGSIFINCNSNIKDTNSNIIIYGHNMKDKQMFGELLKYEDKEYYELHPIIKIVTEDIESEYQIVCVFKSRIFNDNEIGMFKYYQYYNFNNENKYNEYLSNCKKIQLYDTGVVAKYGEQIITLVTCEYSQDKGRIVIVAKRI